MKATRADSRLFEASTEVLEDAEDENSSPNGFWTSFFVDVVDEDAFHNCRKRNTKSRQLLISPECGSRIVEAKG